MEDTATPLAGPVDAPASVESVTAEFEAGLGEGPADNLEEVTQELVNEAEGTGDSAQAEPGTEEDATEPADEAEVTEEAPPNADDPTHKVKVNGEEIEVPLSELLKGYSRTEDYKQKTAAVADERRQVEALRANADADLKAHYANQLEEATNLFAQFDPILAEARTINWEVLKAQDPAAYVQVQDAVQERLNVIQRMNAQVQQARGEAQTQQQQRIDTERAERFDKTADEIVKANPELADEAKFRSYADTNIGFLRDAGFTQEEINDSLDHRVLTIADEARQWRAHKAAQASLPQKKVVPKSAVKPLTSDGGSSQSKPRFPSQASRETKGNWIAEQILSEE